MGGMNQLRAALTYFVVAVAVASAQTGTKERPLYDGHWWIGSPNYQLHLGYLAGEGACYYDDLNGPARKLRSIYSAIELVDVYYYDVTPPNLNKSIPELLGELDDHIDTTFEGGEYYPEKYGYYNGDWWRPAEWMKRVGFVEGYVSCLPDGYRMYPASAGFYAKKISEWYEADELKRVETKIPHVLSRFRAWTPPAEEK